MKMVKKQNRVSAFTESATMPRLAIDRHIPLNPMKLAVLPYQESELPQGAHAYYQELTE